MIFTENLYLATLFWVLLKCSCQVEFYSCSIGNIGNYYFTVSPAENGSLECLLFIFCSVQMAATQACLLPANSFCLIPVMQWRLSTVPF